MGGFEVVKGITDYSFEYDEDGVIQAHDYR